MKEYKKLIRDRITEFMDKEGAEYNVRTLDESQFKNELLKKIVEEANEVIATNGDRQELTKEVADVLEVIDCIIQTFKLDNSEIQKVKLERKEKRGGFEKRIFLESADEKKTE